MLAEERYRKIYDLLHDNKIVTIKEIIKVTNCSESSARRDLQYLEEQGKLIRVHGGARLKLALQDEMDMTGKSHQNSQEKDSIAQYAVGKLQEHDVIYLDAGTTTLAMVKYLPDNFKITVVTNSISHVDLLVEKGINTFILGGYIKNTTKAIVGTKAVKDLEEYRFNKAFIGVNGIHDTAGLTTPDPEEAILKQIALKQSENGYILADSSKFNDTYFAKIADNDHVCIITDSLDSEIKNKFDNEILIEEVKIDDLHNHS